MMLAWCGALALPTDGSARQSRAAALAELGALKVPSAERNATKNVRAKRFTAAHVPG